MESPASCCINQLDSIHLLRLCVLGGICCPGDVMSELIIKHLIIFTDLLIGAYSSNAVVMLKSRPIISVSTHLLEDGLHNIDPGKAGCDLDPDSDHACFSFAACFKVESKEDLSLRIKFSIVAEPKKAVSRVWLKLPDVAEPSGSSVESSRVDHMLFIQVNKSHPVALFSTKHQVFLLGAAAA